MSAQSKVDESIITFNVNPNYTEILRITKEGFIYKGELIEDAGEAYKVWMEVMEQMRLVGGDV
jgi:hypothetical protein